MEDALRGNTCIRMAIIDIRLNPYCYGRCSQSTPDGTFNKFCRVLILIVMEDALREIENY